MTSKLLSKLYLTSLLVTFYIYGPLLSCSPPFKKMLVKQSSININRVKKSKIEERKKHFFYFLNQLLKRQQEKTQLQDIRLNDFWMCLRQDFRLSHDTTHPAVKEQIYWFISRPHQLQRTIKHAAPYIHYVYEQVKKRHLPTELVLLPLIESTYNPFAINKISGASGLWQLTARTAKGFGIRQDWLFDGRHDIYASTHAALDYLTYLNQFFSNDWLLTLAAYDTGEGNVQQAIRYNMQRNLNTSIWMLPLALETRSYVPRLLALSAIISDPKKYGITLPNINHQPYFKQVDVEAGISVIQAAELANISIKQLKQLNPGFKKLIFTPNKPYRLLLPASSVKDFEKKLKALPPEAFYLKLSYYTTRSGDTLSGIAKRYNVQIEHLCLWNGLSLRSTLPIKKKLIIKAPANNTFPLKATYAAMSMNSQYYTVRAGDNLSTIAKHLSIKIQDLQKWNQLENTIIKPGQRLKVYFFE